MPREICEGLSCFIGGGEAVEVGTELEGPFFNGLSQGKRGGGVRVTQRAEKSQTATSLGRHGSCEQSPFPYENLSRREKIEEKGTF